MVVPQHAKGKSVCSRNVSTDYQQAREACGNHFWLLVMWESTELGPFPQPTLPIQRWGLT